MKGSRKDESVEVGVELKYCEHCGGLWVRERGAGVVYCGKCQALVADLPIPKKRPRGAELPVRRKSEVERYGRERRYENEYGGENEDIQSMGGVA